MCILKEENPHFEGNIFGNCSLIESTSRLALLEMCVCSFAWPRFSANCESNARAVATTAASLFSFRNLER